MGIYMLQTKCIYCYDIQGFTKILKFLGLGVLKYCIDCIFCFTSSSRVFHLQECRHCWGFGEGFFHGRINHAMNTCSLKTLDVPQYFLLLSRMLFLIFHVFTRAASTWIELGTSFTARALVLRLVFDWFPIYWGKPASCIYLL